MHGVFLLDFSTGWGGEGGGAKKKKPVWTPLYSSIDIEKRITNLLLKKQ